MSRRLPIYGALLYVVLAWAINMIVAKQILEQMNPLAFAFLRFLAMTPLAFVLMWVSGGRIHIRRRDIPTLLLCSACGFGIYQYLWVFGLANTTPFATALLGATSPIFTLAIVAMARHEHVRPGRWIGSVIALLGVAIFEGAFSGVAAARVGDGLVLASAAVFAGYNVLGSRLMTRYAPLELLAITIFVGMLIILPAGLPALVHTDLHALGWDVWWRILYATLVPILLTYPVWIWGINKLGAGKGSIMLFFSPVLTGILSVPILHASFPSYEVIGALVCLSGMFFALTIGRTSPKGDSHELNTA
ncbi:MAG TPA: DMT family transporter [Candidatus Baltobacteraceae bacterium]|nr:DMT family transporter [Candidatus Baltobacteraceae bacterium]